MKIMLKKGKQKQLIPCCKNRLDITWNQLAKRIRISEGYLKGDILNERRLLSEQNYMKLCKLSNNDFDIYIKERLDDNWGR